MEPTKLPTLTNKIINGIPFVLTKLGDGEFSSMVGTRGKNCDHDTFSDKLQVDLIKAFKEFENDPNVFVCEWHTEKEKTAILHLFNGLQFISPYDIINTNCPVSLQDNNIFNFYKAIQDSKIHKVLIATFCLFRAASFLKVNKYVEVPCRNWYQDTSEQIIKNISKEAKEKNIFMFCAGMGSKCLIAALRKLYPDSLFIDIGSGIDFLCAKRNTRGAALTYEIIENYFKPILPDDWNDPKYDPILKMVPTFLTGCDN